MADIVKECSKANKINLLKFWHSFGHPLYTKEYVEYKIQEINKQYA